MNRPQHGEVLQYIVRNAARLFALCAIIFVTAARNVEGADVERAKRVLMLFSESKFAPGDILVEQAARDVLEQSAHSVEFYAEYLDSERFPDESHYRLFREYLQDKYGQRAPNLVVAFLARKFELAGQLPAELFPNVPVVFGVLTEEEVPRERLGAQVTGVVQRMDFQGALGLILKIQPDTQRIVVIGGTAPLDRLYLDRTEKAARSLAERVQFDFWTTRSVVEMRQAVASLPPRTVILFTGLFRDAAGETFFPEAVASLLAASSSVPIYVMVDSLIGRGVVGGSVAHFEAVGKRVGELAQRVLDGAAPASLPIEVRKDGVPIFDWRVLKRWKISESRLPPGSIVKFRPPSVWEQYRWHIIAALVLVISQGLLITGLIVQRVRRSRVEGQLLESREFIELAASAAEVGLWVRDLAHDELWANARLRSLLGFGQEDTLRSGDVLARVHPDDRTEMVSQVERAQEEGLPVDLEFRALLPDGTVRWVAAKGRTVNNHQGRAWRRMGAVFDITARKQADEQFRLVVEAAPNSIIVVNAEGNIILVNAAVEAVFGYARRELIGRSIDMLVPERFRGQHQGHRSDYSGDPKTRAMGAGRELFGRRKDGSEVPVEIGLTPIRTPEGLLVLASIIDITARKQAEEMTKEERAFLRQVIDIDPNFIFAKDREGRFTLANQAVADAYGTTVENLIGKTDADFNPNAEEVEFFRRMDLEVMDTLQERFIPEERITDAKGRARWLQTVKRPIIGKHGTADQVLGAATDITQRRQAELEAVRQRGELAHIARVSTMGELAASLAHELNQPLGAILSNAEAAEMFLNQEPPALGELRTILADIRKDDQRADDVIQRMRALLKRRELELKAVAVGALIEEAVAMTKADALLRQVKVEVEVASNLPQVRGDWVHLEQVLLNLMLNGMDSLNGCPADQRRLVVRADRIDDGTVELSVRDYGHGIPADRLAKVFEPFYTTKANGMGMGLAISRTIIESHGGRVWAENNSDRGVTFRFTLLTA